MKFECESCHAQYMIADEKVGKRGVKVKCKRCSHVIIVRPDGEAAPVATATAKDRLDKLDTRVETPDRGDSSETEAPPNLEATAPKPTQMIEKSIDASDDRGLGLDDDSGLDAPTSPSEVTGPSKPAPVSMIANQTQLSEPAERDVAATELAVAPPDLDAIAPPPAPPPAPPAFDKTQVQAEAPDLAMPPSTMPPTGPLAAMVKGESSIGDALDDQLAGAFNNMFDEGKRPSLEEVRAETEEEQRGPTRVLDLDAMNALRRQTAASTSSPSAVDKDSLAALRKDFGAGDDDGGFAEKAAAVAAAAAKKASADGADDGPAAAVWHVAIDDEDVGPISLAELGRHIEAGRVERDSLVWKTGMDNWVPAEDIDAIRALFNKVPMPRIAPAPEETGKKGSRGNNSFDVGSPIDDLASSAGMSPFDAAPPMEASDPAWRPHGLTDVYQAANLAEAASAGGGGGLIGGGAGLSARTTNNGPTPAEPEWRPSASSALASLVNDEIDRLSKAPLPAADDDLQPRPADDGALGGGIGGTLPFSSLAGVDLDGESGADVSDPGIRPAASATTRTQSGNVQRVPQQFEQSMAQPAFAPAPPPPARSPLVYAAFAGVAMLGLMMIAVVYKVVFAEPPQQQVVVVGADGRPITGLPIATPPTPVPEAPVATPPPTPTPPVTTSPTTTPPTTTPPSTTTPPTTPTPTTTTTAPPDQVAVVAPPPPAEDPKDATKPKQQVTKKDPPKKETKVEAKEPKEEVKKDPPKVVERPKGCDPVLDFDCKPAGGGAKATDASAKETLEKSDILAVVKTGLPKVKACGEKNGATGTIKMSWKIQTSGKTSDVAVADAKYGGTPTGTCVTNVIKALKFPASKKAPPPVSIPLPLK